MKLLKKIAWVVAAGLPVVTLAQTITTASTLLERINRLINFTIPFIIGLAVLVIIWGVFNYIVGAGDEEKRAQAKTYIIWGVIGIFIMLSVWGLVNILVNTFDLSDRAQGPAPVGISDTQYSNTGVFPRSDTSGSF